MKKYSPSLMRAYAGALLESISPEEIPNILEGLRILGDAFKNESFTDVLFSPNRTETEKAEIIKQILSSKDIHSRAMDSFIDVIVDKRREDVLKYLYKTFESLAYNRKNISKALVVSAISLTEEDLERIKGKLRELLNKEVELEIEYDKSLIGGIKVFVDDQELDLSIEGQLQRLSKQLISEER
ncbi:MAG: ATP synthase F1 subunit delta [Thermotogota bacterium]